MKNKQYAASGGGDRKVYLWDIVNKVQYAVLSGHNYPIWKFSFTNDESSVVSADYIEGIRVWSIKEKKQVFAFKDLEEAEKWLSSNRNIQIEFMKFIF